MTSGGNLTALSSHWARTSVTLTSVCNPSISTQVTPYVNTIAGPGELDMGQPTGAPLQAGTNLDVPIWFDLSATYSDVCGSQPIETIATRLFYRSAELDAQTVIVYTPLFFL